MGSKTRLTIEDLDIIEQACIRSSRTSLYSYRKYISDFKLKTGWFVKEITEAIQQFYQDYKDGNKPILVIQAPPQHGKSEAVTDGIAWMAGQDPRLRFIYASFSERLGVRANLKMQRTMSLGKYSKIFPDTSINDRATVNVGGYLRNKECIEFVEGAGSFRNTTVRGSVTGETLDIGIIDDPIKGREEASSATVRDKTWNWLTDDFMTRFDEMGGLLVILTRWHVDDPIGRLLESGKKVKLLSYPAISEDGEALFPEHKSLDFLLSRKEIMPSQNWEALYQQNPSVPGGDMFRSEWWHYYRTLPPIKYACVYADTAQKTQEKHDYSVFQLWGETVEGQAILIDQVRGKWEAPELLREAKMFWSKHQADKRFKVRGIKVEDKSSGTGLIQTLRREGLPVIPIPRNRDKITRAHDVTHLVESGNVLIPEESIWIKDWLAEVTAFPNGVNDDQVDPMMDALGDILSGLIFDYGDLL